MLPSLQLLIYGSAYHQKNTTVFRPYSRFDREPTKNFQPLPKLFSLMLTGYRAEHGVTEVEQREILRKCGLLN